MVSAYIYHGMDITLDVLEKIRGAVESIAEERGIKFEKAYLAFSQSRTYAALTRPATLMWSESVPFIVQEFNAETRQ